MGNNMNYLDNTVATSNARSESHDQSHNSQVALAQSSVNPKENLALTKQNARAVIFPLPLFFTLSPQHH